MGFGWGSCGSKIVFVAGSGEQSYHSELVGYATLLDGGGVRLE